MDSLPFLPGNSFKDPTKGRYHISQTLGYKNGYQVPAAYPKVGIGGDPLVSNQLSQSELDELANFQVSYKPVFNYLKIYKPCIMNF